MFPLRPRGQCQQSMKSATRSAPQLVSSPWWMSAMVWQPLQGTDVQPASAPWWMLFLVQRFPVLYLTWPWGVPRRNAFTKTFWLRGHCQRKEKERKKEGRRQKSHKSSRSLTKWTAVGKGTCCEVREGKSGVRDFLTWCSEFTLNLGPTHADGFLQGRYEWSLKCDGSSNYILVKADEEVCLCLSLFRLHVPREEMFFLLQTLWGFVRRKTNKH